MNYFNLLNIEQKFDIDLAELKNNYLSCLSKFHPDSKSAVENTKHINVSEINKAYQILKDDLLRAEHLLYINNIDINYKTSSVPHLEEVWEVLEIVQETDNKTILKKLYEEKLQQKALLLDKMKNAFNESNFDEVLDIIANLKYIVNLIHNIKVKLDYATF